MLLQTAALVDIHLNPCLGMNPLAVHDRAMNVPLLKVIPINIKVHAGV
jgi:hypothetical protein